MWNDVGRLSRRPVASVLLVAGAIGFGLGCSNATWQVAVETGQVLAGIVKYPADNPFYMYHVSAFSVANDLSALLLWLTDSEIVTCVILSGLMGMVSFQALALLLWVLNRDVLLATLGALFIYFMHRVGKGQVYPIWLLGHPHTYGILGLSFVVLVIALFGAGARRAAMFSLGLAPAIHASWGIWLFVILCASACFERDRARKFLVTAYPYLLAGLAISLGALVCQMGLMRHLPAVDHDTKRRYLVAYVRYWDSHRRPFFFDPKTGGLRFFSKGVVDGLYSILLSCLALAWFKKDEARRLVFRLFAIAGCVALLLGATTHLPPEYVPSFLLVLMPGRYINLNILTVVACFLGILTCRDHASSGLSHHVFLLLVASYALSRYAIRDVWPLGVGVVALWSAYLAFVHIPGLAVVTGRLKDPGLRVFGRLLGVLEQARDLWPGDNPRRYHMIVGCVMAVLVLGRAMTRKHFLERYVLKTGVFRDRTNDPFFRAVSRRNGMMIIGGGWPVFMATLKTRRPILVPVESGNLVTYVPQAAETFNRMLEVVYGLDLMVPPPKKYRYRDIHPSLYKGQWSGRTVEEWQAIRKEHGARDILAPADWKLSLPVVCEGDDLILYGIPDGGPSARAAASEETKIIAEPQSAGAPAPYVQDDLRVRGTSATRSFRTIG